MTRRSLSSLLLAVGTVAVMLSGLELATRVYAYRQGRGFRDDPKVFISPFFTTEDWPAPYKTGDTYEFKDGDRLTADEARRSVVVVCLGGSTTLSRNAEGRAYPGVLEGLLQRELQTPSVRVMNAGGNAFATPHSLVNFSLRILTPDIKPDVIVVYHNINDLSANYFGGDTAPDYANKYLTNYYLGYVHKTGPLGFLLQQSRFLRFAVYRSNLLRYAPDRDPDTDYQRGAALFERNLRSLAAVAGAHKVDVVFGTQPARSETTRLASHRLYNDLVRKVAAEFAGSVADVATAVTDDRADFIDDVHYTPAGVDKVARAFLPEVRRLVEARLARPNRPVLVTRR